MNGFFTGVFTVLLIEAYLFYRLVYKTSPKSRSTNQQKKQQPSTSETLSDNNDNNDHFQPIYKKWPPGITKYLSTFLPQESQPAELLSSMNILMHRFFVEARESPVMNARLKAKLLEKIGSTGGLVQSVCIDEASLGDHPPIIDSVNIMGSENLDVVFECGIVYEGGITVRITTLLNIGIKIPVSVRVGRLQGRLQIRIPSPHDSRMFAVAFTSDPGLELVVESSLWRRDNEMLKDVLNSMIAKRLRTAFVETFVLPNWRSFSMPLLSLRHPDVEILRLLEPEDVPSNNGSNDTLNNVRRKRGLTLRLNGTSASGTGAPASPLERSESVSSVLESANLLKNRLSLTQVPDCLTSKCFTVNSVVSSANVHDYSQMLQQQFIRLCTGDFGAEKSFQDAWTSSNWESVRERKNIIIQKKTIYINKDKSDVHKAVFTVRCPADRTFQVLSNPEHLRHVEDSYVDSFVIENFQENDVCLRKFIYRFGRQERTFCTLEVKAKVSMYHDRVDGFIVVYRSVRSSLANSNSSLESSFNSNNESVLFLHGYMILPGDRSGFSKVIIVSQYEYGAQKLNPTIQRCHRLKMFIEELAEWSILVEQSGASSNQSDGKSSDRFKNIWSVASQVIKAGKQFASNIGKNPTPAITIISPTTSTDNPQNSLDEVDGSFRDFESDLDDMATTSSQYSSNLKHRRRNTRSRSLSEPPTNQSL